VVFHGGMVGRELHILHVFRNCQVRHVTVAQGGAAGTVANDQGVPGTGYLHVVKGQILHQCRRIQALNKPGADQVMKGQAGQRDDRRGVVEAIQQMHGAWPVVPRQTPSLPVSLA
jgi:hypothetical protein